MSAGSNTVLLMNGTLEVLVPSISDHHTQRFHVSRVYSFIRDWDGGEVNRHTVAANRDA
jgi:hypothetical protein